MTIIFLEKNDWHCCANYALNRSVVENAMRYPKQ